MNSLSPLRVTAWLISYRWLVTIASIVTFTSCCAGEELRFAIADSANEKLPCRIHLRDAGGTPVKAKGLPFWNDHFVCDGSASVEVPTGEYEWEIERGPEYRPANGTVNVESGKASSVTRQLDRIASLRSEGWRSGDLHVHRAVTDIESLMLADDLDFAPVIGWWNTPAPDAQTADKTEFHFGDNRVYCTGAGEDEREGGALLYFGLRKPLDLSVRSREFPSPMHFVEAATRQNDRVWIDIEKPFWWDVPVWLASGKMSSIGIANNHMNRSGMLANEAWGRPRDDQRLPPPRGNGFWTQEIYYHILNSGIRMPPSAGSASGVLKNPVGYNRVYVYLGDKKLTRDRWFEGLKQGRCFVTNGPLLRVRANQTLPGNVLQMDNRTLSVNLDIQLASNDPISDLEVIVNGEIAKRIPCDHQMSQHIKTTINVSQPGWLLVRAIADVKNTFRFASTAPWYLESKAVSHRISRKSIEFFLNWIDDRIERVNREMTDPQQREAVLVWHKQSREFWLEKLEAVDGTRP